MSHGFRLAAEEFGERVEGNRRQAMDHPARRLRDAIEPLAMHAVWSPLVRQALKDLGLSFFEGYVGARAAGLGQPRAAVVAAVFGSFEPAYLTAAYESSRLRCARSTLLEARELATINSLHRVLMHDDVSAAVVALRRGISALPVSGRPLFAGLLGLPWPQDPLGQLWRACELVREHRGDSHVAVWVAAGFDPVEMNLLTELWHGMPLGPYTRTRGWRDDEVLAACERLVERGLLQEDRLTKAGCELRNAIEHETNLASGEVVQAIGPDFDPLVDALIGWSHRCVQAGTFTADEGKRAAG